MLLFSRIIYNQLFATLTLILSLASTTKMIPCILSFQLKLVAFDCHKSRYFDQPDMSNTQKSIPHLVNSSFLQPIVGVIPLPLFYGSIMRARIVDLPALSSPIRSNLAEELPITQIPVINYYKRNTTTMDFSDELPCGGYQNEDNVIKQQLKQISEGKDCVKQECDSCECKKQEEKQVITKYCKKCNTGRAVLLYKGQGVCQSCLFKNIEYKVRLLIENIFKVKKDSNVLLCVSGGLNSTCLANILVDLVKRYQKNKLFNRLGCIHIKQQQQLPYNYAQIFYKQTGIELTVIPIQTVLQRQNVGLGEVKQIFEMFNKSANTIDLIDIFRDRLITKFAEENGFDFVFKGLNGESLAVETFRYFSKGLGGNLPSLSANQYQIGSFYYPLRNNLQKQIQYYYHIKKLAVLAIKQSEENLENSVSSSLNIHIKQFIGVLQNMYSHTAPAIVRTAEKIETNSSNKQICKWCLLPGAYERLCRRCFRIWQARKKIFVIQKLPAWMLI